MIDQIKNKSINNTNGKRKSSWRCQDINMLKRKFLSTAPLPCYMNYTLWFQHTSKSNQLRGG